jgi:hypothetical protein
MDGGEERGGAGGWGMGRKRYVMLCYVMLREFLSLGKEFEHLSSHLAKLAVNAQSRRAMPVY